MPLLNYTTQVPAAKSISEITRILQDAGASAILLENGPDREISAISFRMDTTFGQVPFQLPANVPAVLVTLNQQIRDEDKRVSVGRYRRRIPRNIFGDKAQAERIAWRIAKDWLEAQIALVTIGCAKMEQIMLPFANVGGASFYQRLVERGTLALPAPKPPEQEGTITV